MNTLSPVCFMGRLLLLLFPMKICLNILEKWHPATLSCYLWVIGIHKSISLLWSFMRVYSIMRSVMMASFQVEFLIVIDWLFESLSSFKTLQKSWKPSNEIESFFVLGNLCFSNILTLDFALLFHNCFSIEKDFSLSIRSLTLFQGFRIVLFNKFEIDVNIHNETFHVAGLALRMVLFI